MYIIAASYYKNGPPYLLGPVQISNEINIELQGSSFLYLLPFVLTYLCTLLAQVVVQVLVQAPAQEEVLAQVVLVQ